MNIYIQKQITRSPHCANEYKISKHLVTVSPLGKKKLESHLPEISRDPGEGGQCKSSAIDILCQPTLFLFSPCDNDGMEQKENLGNNLFPNANVTKIPVPESEKTLLIFLF